MISTFKWEGGELYIVFGRGEIRVKVEKCEILWLTKSINNSQGINEIKYKHDKATSVLQQVSHDGKRFWVLPVIKSVGTFFFRQMTSWDGERVCPAWVRVTWPNISQVPGNFTCFHDNFTCFHSNFTCHRYTFKCQ